MKEEHRRRRNGGIKREEGVGVYTQSKTFAIENEY